MSFLLIQKYKYFLLLLVLQLKIILTEVEKCYSIYFCKTCPDLDICEKCAKGYILNQDKSKCILKVNKITASASKSLPKENISPIKKSSAKPSIKSSKKFSAQIINPSPITPPQIIEQKKPSPSFNAPIFQQPSRGSSNNVQRFSPPPFNNPIPNINQYRPKTDDDFYSRITLYWIAILAVVLVILLIIYCSKKVWHKVAFNYCEDNQEEASRIVYIR